MAFGSLGTARVTGLSGWGCIAGGTGRRSRTRSGEALHGFVGGLVDLEQLVEAGDGEDLIDLGVDVGEAELAGAGPDAVVDGDEGAQSGGGEVLDIGEADDELGVGGAVD